MHYLKNFSAILFFFFPLTFAQNSTVTEVFKLNDSQSVVDSGNYSLHFPSPSVVRYVGNMTENIITGAMPFTIEAWVKSPIGSLINRGVSQYDWVYNIYAADSTIHFGVYITGQLSYISAYVTPDEWHHIACQRTSNGYLKIFIDGTEAASAFVGNNELFSNATDLHFAQYFDGGLYYLGKITRIRISKIARYMTNFIPTTDYQNDENTVGLWNFYEGTDSILHDASSNAIHGTIYGKPLWSNDFPIFKTVQLADPNGGENWFVGNSYNINWISSNITNIKIDYTTDNGTNWLNIIASTPANTGTYYWTIPNTVSADCRVRVSDVSNSNINDISKNVFTISYQPTILLNAPNGGESWSPGTLQYITWLSNYITDVKIDYTTNNGGNWITVVYSTPGVNGSYSWNVPNTPSTQCKVKISDLSNSTLFDESDGTFTILPLSAITVSQPNGGEVWQIGTKQNITWQSSNVIDVKIEMSVNNGASWVEVISSTPSTGIYSWTVPNNPTTQCLIKISSVTNPNIYDISNNLFTIEQPSSIDGWINSAFPLKFDLYQNFPNPFNPYTTVYYSIAEESFVKISIYNLLGEVILDLVNENKNPGNYNIDVNLGSYNSGVYLYKLQAGSFTATKKMILMK